MSASCTECGVTILEDTWTRNGGLCAPCKNGTRQSLDAARIQREREKTDPFHILFRRVRDQAAVAGIHSLTSPEAIYYAIAVLFSDLNRGAVQLFVEVNDKALRRIATDGLVSLGRGDLITTLDEAENLCKEQDRWCAMNGSKEEESPHEDPLSRLTDQLLDAEGDVFTRLERYAIEKGLVPRGTAT